MNAIKRFFPRLLGLLSAFKSWDKRRVLVAVLDSARSGDPVREVAQLHFEQYLYDKTSTLEDGDVVDFFYTPYTETLIDAPEMDVDGVTVKFVECPKIQADEVEEQD